MDHADSIGIFFSSETDKLYIKKKKKKKNKQQTRTGVRAVNGWAINQAKLSL